MLCPVWTMRLRFLPWKSFTFSGVKGASVFPVLCFRVLVFPGLASCHFRWRTGKKVVADWHAAWKRNLPVKSGQHGQKELRFHERDLQRFFVTQGSACPENIMKIKKNHN